tara:strand:+ start:1458 stop:2264 length:807 start_codon:yes stop_codon:yes gene_type:complete
MGKLEKPCKKIEAATKKLQKKVTKMVKDGGFNLTKLVPKQKPAPPEELLTKVGYRKRGETEEEWISRRDNFVPEELPPGKHPYKGYFWGEGETRNEYLLVPENIIVYDVVQSDKEAILSFLKDLGIKKLQINFSGGHDSGGEDGAEVWFDFTDNDHEWRADKSFSSTENLFFGEGAVNRYAQPTKWVKTEELSEDGYPIRKEVPNPDYQEWFKDARKFLSGLSKPIWSKYGSFAGDYEVQGHMTYNVEKGTMQLHGNESCWEGFSVSY